MAEIYMLESYIRVFRTGSTIKHVSAVACILEQCPYTNKVQVAAFDINQHRTTDVIGAGRQKGRAGLTPSSCRSPLGQSAGTLRASSQANNWSLVWVTSLRFRHVINGSLAFVLPAPT